MKGIGLCAITLAVSLLSGIASGQSIEQGQDFVDDTAPETRDAIEPLAKQAQESIIRLTNDFRREHHLVPLKENASLQATSRDFASYMARTSRYGHRADGNSPAQRAQEHDYDYCIVLENIAYRYRSTGYEAGVLGDSVFNGWRESPEHRRNMLDPDVTETGVAIAAGDKDGLYYAVQMFGRPESARVEFRIRNTSGDAVHYVLSGRGFENSYELPADVLRRHRMCRPPELKLMRDEQPRTLQVRGGADYVVAEEDGRLTVRNADGK